MSLLLAAAGCSAPSVQDSGLPPEDSGVDSGLPFDAGEDAGDDAGADAGQDAGPTCPAGSHLEDAGCRSSISWTLGPPLALPRDHHATFIIDRGDPSSRFLYVAGGFSQASAQLLKSLVRAPILDDGGLGDWEDAGVQLPAGIAGMGVAQTQDEVIFAGGFNSAKTYTAHINADGSLDYFKPGPLLDAYCFHTTASVHGGYLYVVGGLNISVTTDEIQRAELQEDGGLGPFAVIQHLPYSLSHHVAVVDGDTLYVIGGQTGNPNNNSGLGHDDVLALTFDGDGGLSEAQPVMSLPVAAVTSAGALYNGQLHVLGGITGGAAATSELPSASVYQSLAGGEWSERTESVMPGERSHVHHAPIWNGHIYFVSGMSGGNDSPDSFLGTFY